MLIDSKYCPVLKTVLKVLSGSYPNFPQKKVQASFILRPLLVRYYESGRANKLPVVQNGR